MNNDAERNKWLKGRPIQLERRKTKTHEPYPRLVRDITLHETQSLTKILHLDNTHSIESPYGMKIVDLVGALPKRLQQYRLPRGLGWMKKTSSALCELHRGMNADVMLDILKLIQKEVTLHFQQFEAYPRLISPTQAEILDHLRGLKGLWTKPNPDNPVASKPWPYQTNGCAACMTARVAADKNAVRNLFVVLLSRTRTRKNPRQRTLTPFVDECIRRFDKDTADELFETARELAVDMKTVRKACNKAWAHDPTREHSRRRKHRPRKEPEGVHPALRNQDATPKASSSALPMDTATASASEPRNRDTRTSEYSRDTLFSALLDQVSHPRGTSVAFNNQENSERSRRSMAPSPEPSKRRTLSDLPPAVDSVIGMYRDLAVTNPYSDDSVHSRATTQENLARPQTYQERMRELSYAAVNGTLDGNEGMRREMREILTSSPLPPALQQFDNERAMASAVDVPLVYQYSPSEYSSGEWTDDDVEDWDLDDEPANASTSPSSVGTTWSDICEKNNFI